MFDPLDFITCTPDKEYKRCIYDLSDDIPKIIPNDNSSLLSCTEYDDSSITTIDLFSIQNANSRIILTFLLLLKPKLQVNFIENEICNESWESIVQEQDIPIEYLDETLEYFRDWNIFKIQDKNQLCSKVSSLLIEQGSSLLKFYTNILSIYEKSSDPLKENILKAVSLRISEKCGRTAQPSMSRIFKICGLKQNIQLFEPSLTNDNLGLKTWGSSLILSEKIIKIPQYSKVLELGSGTGLVGIAYAISHPKSETILTDLPEIVDNLKKNIILNNLKIKSAVLDWTNPEPFISNICDFKFDAILIADPIYSPNHPYWIVDMIVKFLKPHGTVYLELPIRPQYNAERDLLWQLLDQNGLCIIKTEQDMGIDDWGDTSYIYKEIKWK